MAAPERVIIQGHVVASKEEGFVASALKRFGWDFVYQQPFFGGRQIAGGFVVDFLVITAPLPTPVWVQGEYWHSGAQAERDKLNQALLRSKIKGYAPAVDLWGENLSDQDETDQTILKVFGRR